MKSALFPDPDPPRSALLFQPPGADWLAYVFSAAPLVFSQIASEEFLEDVNSILNSGEVPDLFLPEDLDKLLNDLRPIVEAGGVPGTRDGTGHSSSWAVCNVRAFS